MPILKWNLTNVVEFLTAKHLERYIPIFKENAIDGNQFKDLTDEALRQDFKMENKYHRKVILDFIQESQSKYAKVEEEKRQLKEQLEQDETKKKAEQEKKRKKKK